LAPTAGVELPVAGTPDGDRRLAALIESVSDAFLALDADWRVTYANREAARLSGVTPEALLGRSHWEIWPWTIGSEVERQYRRAVAEQRPAHFEHFYPGARVWHSIHAYPAEGGGLAIFYRDITAAKGAAAEREELLRAAEVARAEAERANGAKSQFLTTMSHELRTPLNAIAGYVQLLEMGLYGELTDTQRDALARVGRAQVHLLELIDDVLGYARIESGRVTYDVQRLALRDVMSDVTPLVEPHFTAKRLVYDVRLPDRSLTVWADQARLRQILVNLLGNAAKFTPPQGRVTLEVAERRDGTQPRHAVFVRVCDTGIGIPLAKLEKIFEPFEQVANSADAVRQGTGLGLAISRDLARGMGGDLRARSAFGEHTAFTITLRHGDAPPPDATSHPIPGAAL
jgi:PAS domain S-box-containing protein